MFTKKFYKLLLIVTASLFLSISAASAYELNWTDNIVTTPVDYGTFAIGGYQLVNSQNDFATIKQYTDGAFEFTEAISLTVINANDDDDQGIIPPVYGGDFTAVIDLYGYSVLTPTETTVYFTGGSGDIFHGTESILGFNYESSLPATFAATLFSTTGLSTIFDVKFEVDSFDSDYFSAISGPSIQELINSDFLKITSAGRYQVDSVSSESTDAGGTFVMIESSTNGVDVRFDVVPEPTTMLLFGVGLLAFARVSRRKVN